MSETTLACPAASANAWAKREEQLALIEQSPLEEAWENAFEILCKHLGTPTANSWLKPLQLVGFDAGTLTFRAPTKFIGDTVESQYGHRVKNVWASLGYEVTALWIDIKHNNRKDALR